MKKRTAIKFTATLLCAAMLLTAFPLTSLGLTGRTKSALLELSKGLQDGSDAFAFVPGSAETTGEVEYPQTFDLRNVDTDGDGSGDTSYVTPIKFQNPFGTCWSFAATSATETSILGDPELSRGLSADTLNLSEKHTAWFAFEPIHEEGNSQLGEGGHLVGRQIGDQMNVGGWTFFVASLYASGAGPVFESRNSVLEYYGKDKLVFSRGEAFPCPEDELPEGKEKLWYSEEDDWSIPDSYRFMQDFRLRESYSLPSPRDAQDDATRQMAYDAIKEQLVNRRGVAISYCANDEYMNEKTWAHYVYDSMWANHAVCIVGWDDNYPKENFIHEDADGNETPAPEHNGAWLVKNSWGSEEREFPDYYKWGMLVGQDKYPYTPESEDAPHTGYFWLSYEDMSLGDFEAYAYEKVPKEPTDVYQYDYLPVGGVNASSLNTPIITANVFRAEKSGVLKQVACQTTTPGTEVQYTVYLLKDGVQNPTDGEVIAECSATYAYGGFHKETLSDPPALRKGQQFAVAVTQKTPDDRYAFSLQLMYNAKYADRYNQEVEERNENTKQENERIRQENAAYMDSNEPLLPRVEAAFERDEDLISYNDEIDRLNEEIRAYNNTIDEYNERVDTFLNEHEGDETLPVTLEHLKELDKKTDNYSYFTGVINRGESMFQIDGQWLDLSNVGLQELMTGSDYEEVVMDNFPIKAFVTESDQPDELTLHSSADDQSGNQLNVAVPYARRGDVATQLTANEDGVTYSSSDPDLLQVDADGRVTFVHLCLFCREATVTATSADGARTAECTVRIQVKWWQYLIWFLLGSLWY